MTQSEEKLDHFKDCMYDILQQRKDIFDSQVDKHGDCGGFVDFKDHIDNMSMSELLILLADYHCD
jgi:hypothetical protein